MAEGRYVAYFRTSTKRQSLGLEAQRAAVLSYLNGGGWTLVGEYQEQESTRLRLDQRTQLVAAIAHAQREKATLIVSKLDRLSRSVEEIASIMNMATIDFRIAENPSATRLTLHIIAAVAEEERRMISERTKAGLRVIQDGTKPTKTGNPLGSGAPANGATVASFKRIKQADEFAAQIKEKIAFVQKTGAKSYREIADALNMMGVKSPRGGRWQSSSVRNVMLRKEA